MGRGEWVWDGRCVIGCEEGGVWTGRESIDDDDDDDDDGE